MSAFCPDGYVPALDAMLRAATYWFPKQWAVLWERAARDSVMKSENNSQPKPENNLDAVIRAFSQWQTPAAWQDDAWRYQFADIWTQTAHRLRNLLHQHLIKAYYFDRNDRQAVTSNFWSTAAADGVLEIGTPYWPFGESKDRFAQPPSYPLFFRQSELHALLSEQLTEKPGLPGAKVPELVAALRALEHLPNRKKQREALRKQFKQYHLTDDVLREVEKQVPRKPGRKAPNSE